MCNICICITNPMRTNERGRLLREWIELPFSEEERQEVFASLGSEDEYGDYFISDVETYGFDIDIDYASTAHYYIDNGVTTVYITGYGWVSQYGYYLYAFYDKDGNCLDKVTKDEGSVQDLAVSVPENAYELRVNGRKDGYGLDADIQYRLPTLEANLNALNVDMSAPIKLMALGDSITRLGTGDTGWIKYFMEKINCSLVANVSVNGAWLRDSANTVYDGAPTDTNQTNNVLGNQVQQILDSSYEAPDVIIIAIGTNGGISISEKDIASTYYDNQGKLIPLEDVDRTTDAGAYRYCLETLHNQYPDTIIIWSTPIMGYEAIRSAANAVRYGESLKIATQYTGQLLCDTMRCGINGVNEKNGENGEYLVDGLHPNAAGAEKIGYFIASFVKQYYSFINA